MRLDPDRTYIVGVGMTLFGLKPPRTIKEMVREAVSACLADAGAQVRDVQAITFGNIGQGMLEGQSGTPGQMALRPLGFERVPIMNVENGCAAGSTAFYAAWTQVRAGVADIALAVGAEKLSVKDEDLPRRDALFAGGIDVFEADAVVARLAALAEGTETPPVEGDRSVFMDIYAYWARAYMRDFGATQRQLAAIAAKNHHHSVNNPYCQFRKDFTIEEVLAGRQLSYPLTVPMCSPYSDGAAAALICSPEGVRRLQAEAIAVPVEAIVLASSEDREDRNWERHITRLAADRAYELAGVGPEDIDLAEVHDATAFGELLNAENLRLAPRGEAGIAAERGEFSIGGRLPINPSGGLESRGHPIGATGLAQIHELVTQLRGRAGVRQVEGARRAILENGGAVYGIEEAAAVIAILGAPG